MLNSLHIGSGGGRKSYAEIAWLYYDHFKSQTGTGFEW